MKARLIVPVVLSALVLGAILWFFLGGGAGTTDLRELRTEVDTATGPAGGPEGRGAGDGDPSAQPAGAGETEAAGVEGSPAPPGALLHGRVTDASGSAVGGADVLVRSVVDVFSADEARRTELLRELALGRLKTGRPEIVARARTAADGGYSFAISSLPRGQFHVVATAEDLAPQSEGWTWVPESTRIDFELLLGDVIAGVVVGPDGQPVEGATVEATVDSERGGFGGFRTTELADETRSDGEGRFRLNVGDGAYALSAWAAGYSSDQQRRIPAGSDGVLLSLGPGRNLKGVVRDEAGEPLVGVDLSLHPDWGGGGEGSRGDRRMRFRPSSMQRRLLSSARARAASDAKGGFLFTDLDAGRFTILAEMSGFRPTDVSVRVEEELRTSEVEIRMPKGRVLSGRVTDERGGPVASALIAVGRDDAGGRGGAEDRRSREREAFRRRLGEQGRTEELARLEEEERRREERRDREPVSLFRSSRAAETDTDGRFRIDTLSRAVYTLSVQADEFVPYRERQIDLQEGDQEGIEITLDAGIRLEGRVLSSVKDEAVGAARLVFRRRDSGDFRSAEQRGVEADDEGKYRIGGLSAGDRWSVRVDADGYSLAFFDDLEVEPAPATQEVDFRVDPSASVSGRVVDSSGAPVARARVRIQETRQEAAPGEGDERDRRRGRSEMWRQERRRRALSVEESTDAEGRFVLDANPAPALELRVRHGDYKEYRGEPFEVAPGEKVEGLEVQLQMGGRVVVSVRNPDGLPVAAARVQLRKRRSEAEEAEDRGDGRGPGRGRGRDAFRRFWRDTTWRTTDAEGRAVFAGIDGGTYALSTSERGYQPFAAVIDVVEERSLDFVMRLLPENVITGVVVDTLGAPVGGARLRARRSEGEGSEDLMGRDESRATSAEDGTFRIGSLGVGRYDLRVECRGFATGRLEGIPVNSDERITLERLGSISGWVLTAETGAPIPNFEIRIRPRRSRGEESAGNRGDPRERRRQPFALGNPRGGPGPAGGPFFGFQGGSRSERRQRFDAPDGAFLMEYLSPGDYSLEASARGFSGARVDVTVKEGEAVEGVVVRLLEGLSVAGRVVDESNQRVIEGAEIYLIALSVAEEEESGVASLEERRRRRGASSERRRSLRSRTSRGGRGPTEEEVGAVQLMRSVAGGQGGASLMTTDEEGYFRLSDVPAGRYSLLVHHEAYVPTSEEIEVREDRGPMESLVRLDRGEELRGKVTFARRLPAAGVTLIIQGGGGIRKRLVTDASGRYSATGFIPGTYSMRALQVQGSGGGREVSVTVRRGKNKFDYDIGEE